MFLRVKVRKYHGTGMMNYGEVRYAKVWKLFGFVIWKRWLDDYEPK